MNARSSRYAVPGPGALGAAAFIASAARSPLDGYLRPAARHGDAIRVPCRPGNSFYLLSRPEHAEHVLAANQDNRPLRALIGDGLLTSEGERRRHRRVVQPLFPRQHVTAFGPAMAEAARRLTARWDSLAEGTVISGSRCPPRPSRCGPAGASRCGSCAADNTQRTPPAAGHVGGPSLEEAQSA
jgi:cytochrome P450